MHSAVVNKVGRNAHRRVSPWLRIRHSWRLYVLLLPAVAYLLDPTWAPCDWVHSPILTDQVTWSVDRTRHHIRSANFVYRNPIFRDLFDRLRARA